MKTIDILNRKRITLRKITRIMILIIFSATYSGCKKLVEVPAPYTSTNSENVFVNDATAISVLNGIYVNLNNTLAGTSGISYYGGLSADEFKLFGTVAVVTATYQNQLNATLNPDLWSQLYPMVYQANAAIEGLSNSKSMSAGIKQQLLGETYFLRGFLNFYLVNFYGDICLPLTSDYTQAIKMPRVTKVDVYKQILSDLLKAQSLLNNKYYEGDLITSQSTTERVRPNKWVASALLARVYLYIGDWTNAEVQSGAIIANNNVYSLSNLSNTFLKYSLGNNEAIWQLQPTNTGFNTSTATAFVIPPSGVNPAFGIGLSTSLLNSFEPNDQRKNSWISNVVIGSANYFFPYKYKLWNYDNNVSSAASISEYETVFRLGEQFLIRAEAEANGAGTGLNGAVSDLNKIRNRAGLGNYSGVVDKTSLLTAIFRERRVELFSEWGHRWLDIKRSGNADAIMGGSAGASNAKGGTWTTSAQLYPIPQIELTRNTALIQNPGY